MNPLLIVGHPHSGLEIIEDLLLQNGMSKAQPSRSQFLNPCEISCKLLNIDKNNLCSDSENIQQIKPTKVWDELALDLLLANMGQGLWGWSDSQSIYLLDYWKSIEPKLTFILVYNSPETILKSIFNNKKITEEELLRTNSFWQNYNKELSSFYQNNTDRCLLLHAEEATKNTSQFISSLSTTLNLPVEFISDTLIQSNKTDETNSVLAKNLIEQFPECHDTFEELQSVATIPFIDEEDQTSRIITSWNKITEQRDKDNVAHYEKHQEQDYKIELANTQLEKSQQKYDSLLLKLHSTQEKYETIYLTNSKDQGLENKFLIQQLHQLQEELEYYFIENKNLLQIKQKYIDSNTYYGAANRIKNRLSYRLGATMLKQSHSVGGWLGMPWALLSESKKFKNEKPLRDASKLPPISKYKDAIEAEKAKKHLSYRLGKAMIENTNTTIGWFKLPGALNREIQDFNNNGNGKKLKTETLNKKVVKQ